MTYRIPFYGTHPTFRIMSFILLIPALQSCLVFGPGVKFFSFIFRLSCSTLAARILYSTVVNICSSPERNTNHFVLQSIWWKSLLSYWNGGRSRNFTVPSLCWFIDRLGTTSFKRCCSLSFVLFG